MAPAASRRDQILQAARAGFASSGYDGTAVGDLAKTLGISKAAITYYFPAKADLLPALLEPLLEELSSILDAHPDPSWPTGVRQMLRDYFHALITSSDLACWADTDAALRAADRPGSVLRQLDQQLAERISRTDPSRQDHLRALGVIGGLWRPLHHEPAEELLEHIDEIIEAAISSYAPLE